LVPGSPNGETNCPIDSLIDMHRQALSNISSTQSQILSALTNFQTRALIAIQEVVRTVDDDEE
jgi:hypothetical protein